METRTGCVSATGVACCDPAMQPQMKSSGNATVSDLAGKIVDLHREMLATHRKMLGDIAPPDPEPDPPPPPANMCDLLKGAAVPQIDGEYVLKRASGVWSIAPA